MNTAPTNPHPADAAGARREAPRFRDGMTVAQLEAGCRKLAARCGRYPTVTVSIGHADRYLVVWANASAHKMFSAVPDFDAAFAAAEAWLGTLSVPPQWWDLPEGAA